jgi:hypothetical protein
MFSSHGITYENKTARRILADLLEIKTQFIYNLIMYINVSLTYQFLFLKTLESPNFVTRYP